ncbi:MAG: Rnase Y domain-containing protein, partial [Planctomycetaceae bacterium]|nr:Rnase Y domain-containing protein [Planctomycetaceae bacterium]
MDPITTGITGLLIGIALGLFFDRIRMGSAYKNGDAIIAQARLESENVRKEIALKGKEDLISKREDMEKEVNAYRDEVRDQERRLDKRESMLEDQHSDLRKKEQMLEANQSKLAERLKSVDVKDRELDRVLREEEDLLHKISGLDKEAAKDMLLKRIDR